MRGGGVQKEGWLLWQHRLQHQVLLASIHVCLSTLYRVDRTVYTGNISQVIKHAYLEPKQGQNGIRTLTVEDWEIKADSSSQQPWAEILIVSSTNWSVWAVLGGYPRGVPVWLGEGPPPPPTYRCATQEAGVMPTCPMRIHQWEPRYVYHTSRWADPPTSASLTWTLPGKMGIRVGGIYSVGHPQRIYIYSQCG